MRRPRQRGGCLDPLVDKPQRRTDAASFGDGQRIGREANSDRDHFKLTGGGYTCTAVALSVRHCDQHDPRGNACDRSIIRSPRLTLANTRERALPGVGPATVSEMKMDPTPVGCTYYQESFESYTLDSFPSTTCPDRAANVWRKHRQHEATYLRLQSVQWFGRTGQCWASLTQSADSHRFHRSAQGIQRQAINTRGFERLSSLSDAFHPAKHQVACL